MLNFFPKTHSCTKEPSRLLYRLCLGVRLLSLIRGAACSFDESANPGSSDSDIRQVPDNQEVYLDNAGFTSLIFDITERVSHLSTDKEALEYHFADVVAEIDTQNIWSVIENVELPHFP